MTVWEWLSSGVSLLILVIATNTTQPTLGAGGKAFRLAVSNSDGRVLCAVSEINQTSSVVDLPDDNLPPQVRCARQCTSQPPCHSFNYRSDNYVCLFFYYPPTTCHTIPHCRYYQVTKYQSCHCTFVDYFVTE